MKYKEGTLFMDKTTVKDFFDYWHLQYEGNLSLQEFMALNADWSDMDYAEWEITGVLPDGDTETL